MQSELIIIYLHFISITIDPKNGFQVKLSFHIIVQMCLVIKKSYEKKKFLRRGRTGDRKAGRIGEGSGMQGRR